MPPHGVLGLLYRWQPSNERRSVDVRIGMESVGMESVGMESVKDSPDTTTPYVYVLYAYVVPITFGIISLVGVVGNVLVVYVILSNRKMRTVTNILLLNLGLADLTFVMLVPPFTAYEYQARVTSSSLWWPFGDAACKLLHYVVNVTAYVTVYTLVLISLLRYMTVVRGVDTTQIRTKRNAVLANITVWVLMMTLNVPILSSYAVTDDQSGCEVDDHVTGQRIFSTFFVFAYLLPLLIIGLFSVRMLVYMSSKRANSMAVRSTNSKSLLKKRQASRLLVIVVLLFAILWLPIHVHLLISFLGTPPIDSDIYRTFNVISNLMAYYNSCINPFIYDKASKDFRDAFSEAVGCRRNPSSFSQSRTARKGALILTRFQPPTSGADFAAPTPPLVAHLDRNETNLNLLSVPEPRESSSVSRGLLIGRT